MARCAKHHWAGKKSGPNPTDRSKLGTKHSVVTEGHGLPLGIVTAGANCPDLLLLGETLDAIVLPLPELPTGHPNLCLDAGYDAPQCYIAAAERGFIAHIRSRKHEQQEKRDTPGYRPRRWVVEVGHSWINRFRKILVSFEKLASTRLALLQFACAYIVFHRMRLFNNCADLI
jgi:putative transposase